MWRSRIKNQRGQALVEMALVLPILLLIVFGIVEFGRIYTYQLQVNSVARQAARSAAVGDPDDDTALEDAMVAILGGGTVDITRPGSDVKAQVNYSVQLYAPLVIGSANDTILLDAVVTMRDEGL